MKIGKRTQELMNIYALSNEDVAFAQLIAAGRTQLEAYYIAYHDQIITDTAAPQQRAHELLTTRPNIASLIRSLSIHTTDSQQAKEEGQQSKRKTKINVTTKDGQLRELTAIYDNTTSNKERADILKQIADLQRLKQEESREEEQRVHYFLPRKGG